MGGKRSVCPAMVGPLELPAAILWPKCSHQEDRDGGDAVLGLSNRPQKGEPLHNDHEFLTRLKQSECVDDYKHSI